MFADDTSAYLSLEDDIQRGKILNSDLEKIVTGQLHGKSGLAYLKQIS